MTKFFAAANTEKGFVSLFDEIFSPELLRRIYILKGGPGSGKSTLMKRIGDAAEEKGLETEYIYCSSDTNSLDGVIIPAFGTAVLDGTDPHTCDPVYPGAAECIVNLGEAFDETALAEKREVLAALIREKTERYQTAYRFLAAAGEMERARDAVLSSVFIKEKADAAAGRLADGLRYAKKGGEKHRYISAISTDGEKNLDTLRKKAKKFYAVTGKHGFSYRFMDSLYEKFSAAGLAMTVCRTPLTSAHIEAIFIEGGVLFAVCDEKTAEKADKTVNGMRFIRKKRLAEKRAGVRYAERCGEMLKAGALASLREAGILHAKTEKIYGAHIDFSRIDAIGTQILSEIFENNM